MSDKPDWNEFNRKVIEEFRANQGKVGGTFENSPMLLLTSKGAKSGLDRTIPLVYSRDADRYVIIASKAGMPTNPDWYYNLVTNPEPTIEVGVERFSVRAHLAEGQERQRLFDQQAALMPIFKEYEQKAPREIPVFVLERL